MQRKPTKKYWGALGALYGNGQVVPSKPRKKRNRDEEIEQEKFTAWYAGYLEPKGYRWFHPANGGSRNAIEGAKLKRMGVKRGVSDIIMPVARKSYHGLVIELKRVDGKEADVSPEQRDWLEWFKKAGWSTHVAFGFEQAKAIVLEYLR
jgi:hypothetical protein